LLSISLNFSFIFSSFHVLNELIFDCSDYFFDFPQGQPAVASLAMELLKPISGELPRAKKKDRKK